jgi:hypothetical protein
MFFPTAGCRVALKGKKSPQNMAKKNKKKAAPDTALNTLIQDSGVLPVIRDNRLLLAALGGAAAGAALTLIFGSEKTQAALGSVAKSAKDLVDKSGIKEVGKRKEKREKKIGKVEG